MKKKKLLFVRFNLGLITPLITVSFITLGSVSANFFTISPTVAQRISPSDVWQLVYTQLPDMPKENQYKNKDKADPPYIV